MESIGTQTAESDIDGSLPSGVGVNGSAVKGSVSESSGKENEVQQPNELDDDHGKHAPTSSSDVQVVTAAVKHHDRAIYFLENDHDAEDNQPCGWFGINPGCIQWFNNSKGYLLFVSLFVICQGMVVNGLVYVVMTTLETRFGLTSTLSGMISSCYDLTVLVVVIFVTYFGENSHRPRIIGVGAILFGMGSFIFTLPHYLTDYYDPNPYSEIPTCNDDGAQNEHCEDTGETDITKYYACFVAAQVLHGLGASALFTLNMAFLDDNVKPEALGSYVGVFQTMAILGPAVGFGMGGAFLGMYTDIHVDPASHDLTPESPLWVGNWWLPFLVPCGLALLVSIPLLGYPSSLPGSKALKEKRKETGYRGKNFTPRTGMVNKWKDFPLAIWKLIKNVPYMFVCGAVCSETFIMLGISVFGPKYIESQYNMTAGNAALVAGVLLIPAAIIGCLGGGGIIRCLKLEFRGQVKMSLIVIAISLAAYSCFAIQCPTAEFAGVNLMYNSSTPFVGDEQGGDLNAACNEDCNCVASYDPVCGSDGVLYYSACYAGCHNQTEVDDNTKKYYDCDCIQSSGGDPSNAVTGKCDYECKGFVPFVILAFVALCSTFFAVVPQYTMVIRCVGTSQRALALAISSILYRLIGSVPGPLVFGALIDKSCLIWEDECDGGVSCWLYDNEQMAMYFMSLCMGFKAVSLFCGTCALLTYRDADEEEEEEGQEARESQESQETDVTDKGGVTNEALDE